MSTLKIKILIFISLIIFSIATCICPLFPNEQLLQHIGTFILLSLLAYDLKRNNLSIASFLCLSVFVIFHIIGARYIYSYVPYDKWINSLFNLNLSIIGRNHYDRFIHLIFGFLAFPYLFEILTRPSNIKVWVAILLSWALIQTLSMLYEVFEWLLTLVLSSEAADNYNGQQGDIWDAQKDMSLALISSSIMTFIYLFKSKISR